jgi:hypothetical protein
MAETYDYTVKAVCTATVTEKWSIRSPRPLTRADIDDALGTGGCLVDETPIEMHCVEEIVSDEHGREVTTVDGELADDGERTGCGGCGESWNVDDSDAIDDQRYCSADCERRDTTGLKSRGEA